MRFLQPENEDFFDFFLYFPRMGVVSNAFFGRFPSAFCPIVAAGLASHVLRLSRRDPVNEKTGARFERTPEEALML